MWDKLDEEAMIIKLVRVSAGLHWSKLTPNTDMNCTGRPLQHVGHRSCVQIAHQFHCSNLARVACSGCMCLNP